MNSGKKRVLFTLYSPQAETVYLAGSFNDWSPISDPMKKDNDGIWKKTKMLSPGDYQYKFVVDGNWELDPTCQNTIYDSLGVLNHSIQV
ncbi:MAG TPA: glycogen-binding domain-containing protein [Atribacteraceae bacterium]|nr:glycogen-binding domain-containing protein [Atribacteraceae bacterium]